MTQLNCHFISFHYHSIFPLKGEAKSSIFFKKKNLYNVDEVLGLISHILNKKLRRMQLNLVEVVRFKAIWFSISFNLPLSLSEFHWMEVEVQVKCFICKSILPELWNKIKLDTDIYHSTIVATMLTILKFKIEII